MNLSLTGGPNMSLCSEKLALLSINTFPEPMGINVRDINAPANFPLLFMKLQLLIKNSIIAIYISSTAIAAENSAPLRNVKFEFFTIKNVVILADYISNVK